MGIPAWVWFVIAVVAIAVAVVLLVVDRMQHTSRNRQRRRWAALRGWQFAEVDNVLPTRWQYGAVDYYGGGIARDVVAGSTFTADGRRQVYVLDLENAGKVSAVLIGLRCRRSAPAVIELWEPSVPVPHDTELDLFGPVANRYAFVTDISACRGLLTPDFADAVEEISEDIPVVWLEDDWVMAAAPADFDPSRLERLLRELGDVADLVDPFDSDSTQQESAGEPGELWAQ